MLILYEHILSGISFEQFKNGFYCDTNATCFHAKCHIYRAICPMFFIIIVFITMLIRSVFNREAYDISMTRNLERQKNLKCIWKRTE